MTNLTPQDGHMGPKRPRRLNANFIERRRVHQLNERFDQLRQLLPPTGEKQSKVVVLTRCSELIRCQQQVIRDLLLQLDQQQTILTAPTAYKPLDYLLPGTRNNTEFGQSDLLTRAPPITNSGKLEATLLSHATRTCTMSTLRGCENRPCREQEQDEEQGDAGAAGIPLGSPPASDESATDRGSPVTTGVDMTTTRNRVRYTYGSGSLSDSSGGHSQAGGDNEFLLTPQGSAASALIQLSTSPSAATKETSLGGQDGWSSIHRRSRSPRKDIGFSPYRRNLMPDFNASTPTKHVPSLPLSRSYLGWLPGGSYQYPGVKPSLVPPLMPGMMSCSYPYDPSMYNYLASSLMTHTEAGH